MRKKFVALMCSLMCVVYFFSGCSKAEIQYLQMNADILQNMPVTETKGTTTITVDFDALQKFIEDTTKAMGDTYIILGEFVFDGKETIQLDYTMKADLHNMGSFLDLDATYKGKVYDFGELYYGIEGIYVTSQTLQGVYDLMQATLQQYNNNYMFDETYAKDFKAILDKNEYIRIYGTQELQEIIPPADGYNNLYKAALDLYKNGFENFTTGLLTEVPNGFRVEATGEQIGQMVLSLLDYIASNPEPVLNALEQYILLAVEINGLTTQDIADLKDGFAQVKQNIEPTKNELMKIKDMLSAILQQPAVKSALKGFSYKVEITQNNGVYITTENYVMGNVCTIEAKSTIQKATDGIVYPKNSTRLEDLMTQMQELIEKYNPVTSVKVMWLSEDELEEALVSVVRKEQNLLFSDFAPEEIVFYVVEGGHVYLPLRDICDALGVFVTWDKDTKTASAYLDKENMNQAIKLETKLIDGVSYVGIREFEKLGYDITYTNTEGIHQVNITK